MPRNSAWSRRQRGLTQIAKNRSGIKQPLLDFFKVIQGLRLSFCFPIGKKKKDKLVYFSSCFAPVVCILDLRLWEVLYTQSLTKIGMLHFGVKIFDAAASRLDLILGGEGWYIFWRVPVALGWESVWSPTFSPAGRRNRLAPLLPPWNLPVQPGLRAALTLTRWTCPDGVQCICHGPRVALTEHPRGLGLHAVA